MRSVATDLRKLQRLTREWARAKKNKTMADLVAAARLFDCRIEDTKEGKSFWPSYLDIDPVHVPNPHPQKEVLTGYVSKFVSMMDAILWKLQDADEDPDEE